MKKTYGKEHAFANIVGVDRVRRDVFSDSTSSCSSTGSTEVVQQKTRCRKASKHVLTDVGNVQRTAPATRPKRNVKEAKKKNIRVENIPNFDSFDDYELIVQPPTALKTHVSISAPTTDDNWDNYPTDEIVKALTCCNEQALESPVTSSPKPTSSRRIQLNADERLAWKTPQVLLDKLPESISKHSGAIADSCSALTGGHRLHCSHDSNSCSDSNLSSRDNHGFALPISMHTRRAKRLRHLIDDGQSNMNFTSTPEQHCKKMTRTWSPVSKLDLSHIPALELNQEDEVDELAVSIAQVSIHDSLKGLRSPVIDCEVAIARNSEADALAEAISSMSIEDDRSGIAGDSGSFQQSASLFTTSFGIAPTLASILETEEDEECHSESIDELDAVSKSKDYVTAVDSTNNSYHTAASANISQRTMDKLMLSLQKLKTPTLTELSQKRHRNAILRSCQQQTFYEWVLYRPANELEEFVKIGEGVYGEVFRFITNGEVTVIKVVPMEGDCTVNDEPQKRFHEMAKEIEVTKELSDLGFNFINTKKIVCVQGVYPDILLDKWDNYSNSENDRPDYFSPEQYYAVFEFSDGGKALESYEFATAAEAMSCILQVGWALAIAEDYCQFEHRDLHWGNVLIAQESSPTINYRFHSKYPISSYSVNSCGVKVNIIDFTLSRLVKDDKVIYFDLAEDETLFQGVGDYQFDVYRQMKDVTRNEWQHFNSVTNIFWMRYLADKLLKNKSFPSKRGQTPTAAQLKKSLLSLYERCAHYHSAVQMVLTDKLFQQYSVENND